MNHITSLQCLICGKEYQSHEVEYVCPDHGYEGILDVQYDYGLISLSFSPATLAVNPDYSIWRYKPLLPIEPDSPVPPLAVGWTPRSAASAPACSSPTSSSCLRARRRPRSPSC
jgi:threonine synthase